MSGPAPFFRTLPQRIVSGDRFIGSHQPPDWLLDGIIQKGRLYALTSLTAHGKTAIALYIACMIHIGRMVGALDVFQGNVLYLAGENPSDLAARLLGMARHFKIPALDLPFVLPQAFPLTDEELDRLRDDITNLGIDFALIIGDTAASFFDGDDENNNVQAGAYARHWRELTQVPGNPAVMPLCHPIKNAARDNLLPRGGGAFLNELDANLTLWSASPGEQTTLHWHGKIRGPDFTPLDFRLLQLATGLQDDKGRNEMTIIAEPMTEDEATDRVKQNVAGEDAVLRSLYDHPDWTRAQIARDVGWLDGANEPERWRVSRALKGLAEAKLVRQLRRGDPWEVSELGLKTLRKRYPQSEFL